MNESTQDAGTCGDAESRASGTIPSTIGRRYRDRGRRQAKERQKVQTMPRLPNEIAQLKQERDDYREQALRARAEFANYQKRAKQQADSDRVYAVGSLAQDLWIRSTTSSGPSKPCGPRAPRGSPRGSTWSRSSCSRSWPSTASSRSGAWAAVRPNLHEAIVQQPTPIIPRGRSSPSSARATRSATACCGPARSRSRPNRLGLIRTDGRAPARLGRHRGLNCASPCSERGRVTMPTYDYICDACGHEFEAYEPITSQPRTECPECKRAQAPQEDRRRAPRSCSKDRGFTRPIIAAIPTRRPPRRISRQRAGQAGGRIQARRPSPPTVTVEERAGQARRDPPPKSES